MAEPSTDQDRVTARPCLDCGQVFYMDAKSEDWFLSRGFKLPKRCRDCREYRRAERDGFVVGGR